MTHRERSILIAVGAIVLALGGLLLALQSFGGGGGAPVAEGGQSIDNGSAGAPSDVAPLDDQGNLLATGAGGTATGGLNPAEPTSSLAGAAPSTASTTTAAPTSAAPTTTETPSVPTVADSQASSTTAAPANNSSTGPASSSSAPVATAAPTSSTSVAITSAPATAPPITAAPSSSTAAPATPPPTDPPSSGLHAIEREILQLTNQLRANPSGPLARVKPMPTCVNEDFYGITISGSTGHPDPVPALTLNEAVSIELARDWSIEMDRTDNFEHRSNESASAIYDRLGISWQATGENIAWFRGYPDSEAATIFFEGWRESDTGHYCALISGTYTHIGVGYYKGATSSWSTQNFYRPR